ncbi:hypothetical protein ACHHYP_06065 [Achlya hypogyna]|uniref:Uncharacterized protein n=1 Tax=Achlya hypogyna TaxID=1202772 RepID=A0A1V9YVH8_ACHHY|nr:hypothetical protein ACHHYP_06065 [Achlya hypogyna]
MLAVFHIIVQPYTQNDFFWTGYNSSGAASFIADTFNAELWPTEAVAIPLFAIDGSSAKDYLSPSTTVSIPAAYSRRMIIQHLSNIEVAVPALRRQTIAQSVQTPALFCWLDFEQQWVVAFTERRAARCAKKYKSNGAVYYEAILRNTDWAAWSVAYGSQFETCYGAAVRLEVEGVKWLTRTTSALAITTVEQELAHWRAFGINRYTIHWHNYFNPSLYDSYVNDSNGIVTLQQQRILTATDPAWSFYGWLTIVDWVDCNREVVSLAGDWGTVVAMSKADACQLPFIFAQYCYVDFKRRWSLAYSSARVARCSVLEANAAVYLEAGLRNTKWNSLQACGWWGSMDTAVLAEVELTSDGQAWIAATAGALSSVSVSTEVSIWTSHGLTEYTVQWQNYKWLGVNEILKVINLHHSR